MEPQDLAAQGAYKEVNAVGLRNVVETLLQISPETGEIEGVLAESWEVVDSHTVRLKIREGVTFHDGTALDAETAAYMTEFVWDKDNNFTIQEYGGPQISARAIGDYEMEVTTDEPDPTLLHRLTLHGITSRKQIEEDASAHSQEPIGTGPYRFVEWQRGSYWSAERWDGWWGYEADDAPGTTEPPFERLRFEFRPEEGVRTAMAKSGEAHIAMFPAAADCNEAEHVNTYTCLAGPSDTYLYARLDHPSAGADPRLGDKRIREAFFLSIDAQSLNEHVIEFGTPLQGQLSWDGVTGFNPELDPYPYDPDRAAGLLGEAESDGVDVAGIPLEVRGRTGATPGIGSIVEAIGGMVNDTGFNAQFGLQEPAVANEIINTKPTQDRAYVQVHVRQNPFQDLGLVLESNYYCASRAVVWCDDGFDAELENALTLSGTERAAAFEQLAADIHGEYVIYPLSQLERSYLVNDGIADWEFGLGHRLQAIYMTPAS